MLGRLRGKSKAPEQGSGPPTPEGDAAKSKAKMTTPTSSDGEGKERPPRPSKSRGSGDLRLVQMEEDLKRERIHARAGWEYQDLTTVCLSNALIMSRRENLGQGRSEGDMWCLKDLSKTSKKEAVEFGDSDGDAVRMLLNAQGKLNLCVNGVVRGAPKQMRYDFKNRLLRATPWRIGLSHIPDEDLPTLLAYLGTVFSKAGIVHNLPTDIPEDDRDELAELKQQFAKERESMGSIMEELDTKTDQLQATKAALDDNTKQLKDTKAELDSTKKSLEKEVEQLREIVGKKNDEGSDNKEKIKAADKRLQAMQAALDQAVVKRKDAEAELAKLRSENATLKRESETGRTQDKIDIDNLTNELSETLDESSRYKQALAELELKNDELQSALNQAALRRQQAEQALAEKEDIANAATDKTNHLQQMIETNLGNDIELLEEARRTAIEGEERGKREYFTLWCRAEAQVYHWKNRYFISERNSAERLESAGRLLLEAEERGRREYQGIWLRAELRQVANDTASTLERGAVSNMQERYKALQRILMRSRHAYSFLLGDTTLFTLSDWSERSRYYNKLRLFVLWRKFDRHRVRASDTTFQQNHRLRHQVLFDKWKLWASDHRGDRVLAIRKYMLQRPTFYLYEEIARLREEQAEKDSRNMLLAMSHFQLVEMVERQKITESHHNSMWEYASSYVQGPALAGTRVALSNQMDMLKKLLALEEDKVAELQRAVRHLQRQRDDQYQRCSLLMMESFEADVLRLLYAHAEGKRMIELEWAQGLIASLWDMVHPKKQPCDGWMLMSIADWQGGGTWHQKYVWLDKDRGQLLYSNTDPRRSGGPQVHAVRLANIVAVEVELFADGATPPPVNRYQQLGFYVELAKGGKHRFCAATVGERTEWLDNLRRAVLGAWKASESPHTHVATYSQQDPVRLSPQSKNPMDPPTLSGSPSPSYRKMVLGLGRGYNSPQRTRSPRRVSTSSQRQFAVGSPPRSHSPRVSSYQPPVRRSESLRRSESPSGTMPLEHLSYIGLP